MSCLQTLSGLARDCATNLGGIVAAWIANFDDVTGITVTDNKITGISTAADAKVFKKYEFRPESGNLAKTLNVSDEGSNYVSSVLTLLFNRMETTKRVEVAALTQAETAIIVKDRNGIFWYLGKEQGVRPSAGDGQTGTALGDRNGYQLQLEDRSSTWPFEILVGNGGVNLEDIADRV